MVLIVGPAAIFSICEGLGKLFKWDITLKIGGGAGSFVERIAWYLFHSVSIP